MGLADALAAVGVLITAAGGVYIAIHETRRRERKVTRKEINELVAQVQELDTEVVALQKLLLEQRRYIYKLVTMMIDHGMNPPQPPAPSFDPGEYDDENIDQRKDKGDGNS